MSDPTGPAGWFPDPHGRYEHRWFNGHAWTNDVATDGTRFVDTGGPFVTPPGAPFVTRPGAPSGALSGTSSATRQPRPRGVASFVVALVAVIVAWMPFVAFVGLAGAAIALVLGIRAIRSARSSGAATSGFAVAGVVLAAIAVPLSAVGIWLSFVVWGEVRTFLEPGPLEAAVTECTLSGTVASAEGAVTNLGTGTTGYTVTVRFLEGASALATTVVATRVEAAPGDEASFGATAFIDRPVAADDLLCEIVDVRGPFPFGVEVNPPTSP